MNNFFILNEQTTLQDNIIQTIQHFNILSWYLYLFFFVKIEFLFNTNYIHFYSNLQQLYLYT